MSNNSSSSVLSLIYGGYTVQGFVFGCSNLLIALSIARFQALRLEKEYVLLMALAAADSLNMFAFFFGGVYRLWILLTGRTATVSPASCLLTLHVPLWLFSDHISALMLLLVSADRLQLVLAPLDYLAKPARHAWRMVKWSYAFTLSMGLLGVALIATNDQTPDLDPLCFSMHRFWSDSPLARFYSFYKETVPQLLAASSVLVYLIVGPVYCNRKVNPAADQQYRLSKQRKLTRSLAISVVCTLLLYCVPSRLAFWSRNAGHWVLAPCLWMVCNCNSFANMIIYQLRHGEMRVALKALFTGKELPINLDLWPNAKIKQQHTNAVRQDPDKLFSARGAGQHRTSRLSKSVQI